MYGDMKLYIRTLHDNLALWSPVRIKDNLQLSDYTLKQHNSINHNADAFGSKALHATG